MSNSPFGEVPNYHNEEPEITDGAPLRSPFGLEGTAPTETSDEEFQNLFLGEEATEDYDDVDYVYESDYIMSLGPNLSWVSFLFGAFMLLSGLLFGDPISATGNLVILGLGATMFLLGVHGLVVRRRDMSAGTIRFGVAATALFALIFTIGFFQQNSIDGSPVLKFTSSNADANYTETLLEAMDLVEVIDNAIKVDPVVLRAKQSEAEFLYSKSVDVSADLLSSPRPGFEELTSQVSDTVYAAGIALDKAVAAVNQSQEGRSEEADTAYQNFLNSLATTVVSFEAALNDPEIPVTSVRPWMQDLFNSESE